LLSMMDVLPILFREKHAGSSGGKQDLFHSNTICQVCG